ncbi:uncharacterized protein Z518_08094 [Rhinocladiella mackenziei CBS 650.93]|uniref:Xylanolytic transcriptional activator regulatory domain-containing protein n=1 Tax=Rhinocladiella mackenziei CBS 650.93 TaxID=1442369 RepID=A0A0D2IZV2_9EURO|nr:uncharacterized protein Z518_08094 [Rhinocladiella mackenziei CBS 650.93]KIX02155.1 hypothetical protein Z518_08094 [Rhinocladiella mackenziei CBS 650.93]
MSIPESLDSAPGESFLNPREEPYRSRTDQKPSSKFDVSPSSEPWPSLSTSTVGQEAHAPDLDSFENGWNLPNETTGELVELFFDNVQSWLPIIYRPSFDEKFMRLEAPTKTVVNGQSIDPAEVFMITSMFAIAARFSTSPFFKDIAPPDRGDVFATRAATIKDGIIKTIDEPSLEFVKGLVILAFYHFAAGQLAPGSVLTSVCVRFAYDLSLDEVDEDQINDDGTLNDDSLDDVDAWVRREELRRLWWSIWELDTFVATLSRQPYGIERGEMKVFLPVSDHQWVSRTPIRSSPVAYRPDTVWKSLQGSPNQAARAWFLVTNYLMSCIAHAGRQPSRISPDTRAGLESALCCLKLSLPTEFQLRSLYIGQKNFPEGNWIISTHLMILA